MHTSQRSITRFLMTCVLVAALLPVVSEVHSAVAGGVVTDCSNDTQLSDLLAGGGTITFNCGTAVINLSSSKVVNVNTTIDGGGKITLNGQGHLLFYVWASLTLRNIVLTNGYNANNGGAIYSEGILILENSTIRNSQSALSGGAIFSYGPLTITNSLLENNQALNGGALYPRLLPVYSGAQTTIINSTLRGNKATDTTDGWGGAILAWVDAPVTIKGGSIYNNTANKGGGIYSYYSTVTMTNVTLSNNSATDGGGIYNHSGTAAFTNVTLNNNSATNGGGGLNDGMASLTNVTLSSNSAVYGGGLLNYGTAMLNNATLRYNSSSGNGGGLDNAGTVTLTNATLSGNFAISGGGLFSLGTATLTNTTLSGNSATNGGGLYNYDGSAMLTNVTLSDNTASTNGGGIYHIGGSVNIKNTIVANSPSGGNCSGGVTNNGFNFSSDNTCSFGSGRNNVNVRLGPLANNGGPTLTHMPQPGSPVTDTVTAGCPPPSTDQRGARRPFDGDGNGSARCDAGAVEYGVAVSVVHVPLALKNYWAYFEGPGEVEPNNNSDQANGPLRSGRPYSGYPNDTSDYYSIYLLTTGRISATVTNFRATGQLVLRNENLDTLQNQSATNGAMTVAMSRLPAGKYYLQVFAEPVCGSCRPYTLTATFP